MSRLSLYLVGAGVLIFATLHPSLTSITDLSGSIEAEASMAAVVKPTPVQPTPPMTAAPSPNNTRPMAFDLPPIKQVMNESAAVTFRMLGQTSFRQQHLAITATFNLTELDGAVGDVLAATDYWTKQDWSKFKAKDDDDAWANEMANKWLRIHHRVRAANRRLNLLQTLKRDFLDAEEDARQKRFVPIISFALTTLGLAGVAGVSGFGFVKSFEAYDLAHNNSVAITELRHEISALRNLTTTFQTFTIDALSKADAELSHHSAAILAGDIDDHVLRAEAAFAAATLARIHPSVLADGNTSAVMKEVNRVATRLRIDLFAKRTVDLTYCRTLLRPFDGGFHVDILVPAGPSSSLLNIYQPYVLPIPIDDSTFVSPDIDGMFLAISPNTALYTGLTTADLENCRTTGSYYDCEVFLPVRRNTPISPDKLDKTDCMYALYKGDTELAAKTCPTKFVTPQEDITMVGASYVALFSTTTQYPAITCPSTAKTESSRTVHLLANTPSIVSLPPGCTITTNRHEFHMPPDRHNVSAWIVSHRIDLSMLRPPGDLVFELKRIKEDADTWFSRFASWTPTDVRQAHVEYVIEQLGEATASAFQEPWSVPAILPSVSSTLVTVCIVTGSAAAVFLCCCRRKTVEPIYASIRRTVHDLTESEDEDAPPPPPPPPPPEQPPPASIMRPARPPLSRSVSFADRPEQPPPAYQSSDNSSGYSSQRQRDRQRGSSSSLFKPDCYSRRRNRSHLYPNSCLNAHRRSASFADSLDETAAQSQNVPLVATTRHHDGGTNYRRTTDQDMQTFRVGRHRNGGRQSPMTIINRNSDIVYDPEADRREIAMMAENLGLPPPPWINPRYAGQPCNQREPSA
mgnify:CR=1 FL=1